MLTDGLKMFGNKFDPLNPRDLSKILTPEYIAKQQDSVKKVVDKLRDRSKKPLDPVIDPVDPPHPSEHPPKARILITKKDQKEFMNN